MPPVSDPSGDARPAWVPTFPLIRKIDDAWYRTERAVCGAMFLVMALLVFAAVVQETFGNRREWIDLVVLFGVALLAVRTRAVKAGERRIAWPMALAIATALTAAIAGAMRLYVEAFEGGLIWAQKLTLVLMMWVALLGASMATHDRSHLALELGEKLWPRPWLRWVRAIAQGVTAAFCVIALIVTIHLVAASAEEGGLIEANRWLARWQALLILPYAFAAMAIRFLAQAVTIASGRARPPDEEQLPT